MDAQDALYIVIPGIAGSVLTRGPEGNEETVWASAGQAMARLFSPDVLSVDDDDGIRATGIITSWRVLPGLVLVRGYEELVRNIANFDATAGIDWGNPATRDLDARVVAFPYDFRRSITQAAEALNDDVATRLKHLADTEQDKFNRVIIVAHSMGGLVARYWAGCLGGAKYCKAIITLGTPHRGAPKAADVLSNGLRLGPVPVPGGLSDTVRSWDSAYELLPRYRCVQTIDGPKYPKDLDIRNLSQSRAKAAFKVHTDIESGWNELSDEDRPSLTPVMGIGVETTESLTFTDGQLTSSRHSPGWMREAYPEIEVLRGDGTVPRVSALPIELDDSQHRPGQREPIGTKHGALAEWSGLEAELRLALDSVQMNLVRGATPRTLVVDIEEAWPSGTEQSCSVRLLQGTGRDLSVVDDLVAVQYNFGQNWHDASRTTEGDWKFDLPPLPSSDVQVAVRATTSDGNDPSQAVETCHVADLGNGGQL